MPNYTEVAREARKKVLELIYKAQTSHIGSNFSAIDIMAVLFEKVDLKKDEVILSAGWKAAAWYYFLWKKGIITKDELNSYCQEGTKFIGLVEPQGRWGLRFAGGSMQLGTGASLGFALAKKIKKEDGKIYVLESDGGMQGGIIWESIMLAAHHNLNNLVLILDDNSFQAMGRTDSILNGYWHNKLESFGWYVQEIDGHNFLDIESALNRQTNKPYAIIAKTIKGHPISFMSNNNFYHYANLTHKMYKGALKELNDL